MNPTPLPPTETRSDRSARLSNHIHRYFSQLRRHWWLLPMLAVFGLAIQAYLLHTTPPSFQSIGRMIVNIKIQLSNTATTYTEELSNFLGTQVALMQSGNVTNRAVSRVLAVRPELRPAPVKLRITVSPKTSIFNLEATGLEPEFTRAYLDACMEQYIDLKKEMRTSTSDTTLAGITTELVQLEGILKKGEAEMLVFQSSNSVVFLEEQGNSAGGYLAKLTRQLADLNYEAQLLKNLTLEQNLERRQKTDAGTAKETGTADDSSLSKLFGADSEYLKVRQEIGMLKAEQKELAGVLRPKHPKMIDLTDRLTQKEKLLEILRGQSEEQLANRRGSIELQVESLRTEIKEWETKSLDISKKMAEYQRLKANNARTQSLYDRLLATLQTLGVDKDINPETVTILEKATVAKPTRGSDLLKLIASGVAGLLAGLVLLLLLDRFDDRPNSFTDLQEMFDEPVLTQIPREKQIDQNGRIRLLEANDKRHTFREAFRNLRSSLLYMSSEAEHPRTLLVTSAIPNEGKSVTTANLAITLAQAGGRVLLVDGDLRKGVQHERFGVESTPGFTETLLGEADWKSALRPTHQEGLFLLPRGRTSTNPSEMFLSKRAKAILEEFGNEFDWVVLDSAPVMAADDVATLAPRADGVIFVLRAGHTSARISRAALDLLYQRNVKIFGLAFNSIRPNSSDYYYYKYKSYYHVEDGGDQKVPKQRKQA